MEMCSLHEQTFHTVAVSWGNIHPKLVPSKSDPVEIGELLISSYLAVPKYPTRSLASN